MVDAMKDAAKSQDDSKNKNVVKDVIMQGMAAAGDAKKDLDAAR